MITEWRPNVFVSFTTRGADGEFVKTRLLPCLQRQRLNVWIYESEEGEIPGGRDVNQHLRERIDDSEVFLPVISPETFRSPYTALEVEYAQQCQARGIPLLIIPLVSQQLQREGLVDWPGPYARLKGIRYRALDFHSATSLEDTVVELCHRDLNIEYALPPFADPRLPYLDRFYAEVRGRCPRRDDREVGIYCRLLGLLHRFSDDFEQEQFEHARWSMQFFCMMCEYEFPGARLYYPYVVRAVCEQLAGDPAAAETTFRGLLSHPAVDESTYSGLGQLCYLKKDYEQALEYYQQAQARCRQDAAAAHGVLLNSVMCGKPVDVDEAIRVIDQEHLLAEDRAKVQHVKAFALANAGRFPEATKAFVELVQARQGDASTIVHFARLLTLRGEWNRAIDLLRRFRDTYPDAVLWHDLATYVAQRGQRAEAVGLYRTLTQRYPDNRRYRIELAQVLWWSGDRDAARQAVESLLAPPCQRLPASPEDFFFDGFANWISGRKTRAEYDFERSGFAANRHYRNLLCTE